ncbi:MAG TPA: hypothetical protein VGN83_24260 [Falsiroseomonas sp.]|jgi:hypothetical protein|nr:hypothetical protein [Falsiroseomonas sp.]
MAWRRLGSGPPAVLAAIGAALLASTAWGTAVQTAFGPVAFAALAIGQGLLVLLALRIALRCEARRALALIAIVAVGLRLLLLPIEPNLSSDAYRYVWDGRVQSAGINPYRHVPRDPALEALRDEAIHPHINRADYAVTIYPPAAQMLFLAVNQVADGLLAMKLAFILCEVLTVAVLLDLLRRLSQPPVRVLAYAWHPLAVWEVAGNAHIDAAMVGMMMLGLWVALVPGRRLLATAILAVAALVKPPAALLLSLVWRAWDWRAPAVAITVAALLYLPYLSVGTGVIGFLPEYLGEERIAAGDGFWLVAVLQHLFGPIPWARPLYLAGVALLIGTLALAVALGRDTSMEARLRRLFWLLFASVALLSPDYPWYWLIVLPFVVLLGPPPAWAATIGAFVFYAIHGDDPAFSLLLRESALYLAIIATLLLVLRTHRAAPALAAGDLTR